MTWLSEIEDNNRFIRTCMRTPESETRSDRMARVIREQNRYILYLEGLLKWVASPHRTITRESYLSPDAKELLDDTTAPRST